MPNNAVYKQIALEMNAERNAATRLLNERKADVYVVVPRIKEIDCELSQIGINIVKKMLSGGKQGEIGVYQKKSGALNAEREKLLKKQGFPVNYTDEIYKCAVCKDTGFDEDRNKCACVSRRIIEKLYDMSTVGKVLKRENFDTFQMKYYSEEIDPNEGLSPRANMKYVLGESRDFVKNFGDNFNNMLLYGETGLGKTFLCNCIAKELLNAGFSVLYATAPQLFKKIENERFGKNNDENELDPYIEFIYSADLLIIDDLGAEFITSVK